MNHRILYFERQVFMEVIEEKYECVCCGARVLTECPPGTYEVCPMCGWEDDKSQFLDPDYGGGANPISLNQAKIQFQLKEKKEIL